jgi:hypothetical protein
MSEELSIEFTRNLPANVLAYDCRVQASFPTSPLAHLVATLAHIILACQATVTFVAWGKTLSANMASEVNSTLNNIFVCRPDFVRA